MHHLHNHHNHHLQVMAACNHVGCKHHVMHLMCEKCNKEEDDAWLNEIVYFFLSPPLTVVGNQKTQPPSTATKSRTLSFNAACIYNNNVEKIKCAVLSSITTTMPMLCFRGWGCDVVRPRGLASRNQNPTSWLDQHMRPERSVFWCHIWYVEKTKWYVAVWYPRRDGGKKRRKNQTVNCWWGFTWNHFPLFATAHGVCSAFEDNTGAAVLVLWWGALICCCVFYYCCDDDVGFNKNFTTQVDNTAWHTE